MKDKSAAYIRHYPKTVFATLVCLRCEHEALALAELIEAPVGRAQALCTIAEFLRKCGDGQKQHILPLLAQAQKCLASIQDRTRINHIQEDLVEELVWWQQWLPAQELAAALNDSWGREWAFTPIFQQKLQAGLWEEALAVARSAGDAGHRWMFCSVCEFLARAHAWDDAEEVAGLIKRPDSKVEALSVLARELTAASHTDHAQACWQQAIKTAFEEGVNDWVFGDLSENLARAHQWELAESVARALTFPLPGAQVRAKQPGRILDQQAHDRRDALWIPVVRSKALATLAVEAMKAQHETHVDAWWAETRVLASSCESTWHRTTALGNLALCFAQADLWEISLATWREAEAVWKEAQAQARRVQESSVEQNGADYAVVYEGEEEQRRLKALLPLCRQLVKARRWKQAWQLCCELEDARIKIRVGREIAAVLEEVRQSEDAQIVWRHTTELALTIQLHAHDLAELALALQQARHWQEADAVWKACVASALEDNQDNFDARTINSGSLALKLAQAQRWEEARLLLNECMRAAALVADADL